MSEWISWILMKLELFLIWGIESESFVAFFFFFVVTPIAWMAIWDENI